MKIALFVFYHLQAVMSMIKWNPTQVWFVGRNRKGVSNNQTPDVRFAERDGGRHHTPQAILLGLEGADSLWIPAVHRLNDTTQVPTLKR